VVYRSSIKKILIKQIQIVEKAIQLFGEVLNGCNTEEALNRVTTDLTPSENDWLRNALTNYLKCFEIYQADNNIRNLD